MRARFCPIPDLLKDLAPAALTAIGCHSDVPLGPGLALLLLRCYPNRYSAMKRNFRTILVTLTSILCVVCAVAAQQQIGEGPAVTRHIVESDLERTSLVLRTLSRRSSCSRSCSTVSTDKGGRQDRPAAQLGRTYFQP